MKHPALLKPFKQDKPVMPAKLLPVTGGDVIPDAAMARALKNPIPASETAVQTDRGYYSCFCRRCHGDADSSRTPVGNSHMPISARLDSAPEQGPATVSCTA